MYINKKHIHKMEPITYAIITIIYNDKKYKSIPLDITNYSDNMEIALLISESGTTKLSMFKLPISNTKFIIFSREQLDSCLFEFEITTKKPKTTQVEQEQLLIKS